MHKRVRENFPKSRPVEKEIRYILKPTTSTTTIHTPLYDATFPCTVENLRWSFSLYHETILSQVQVTGWAIIVVRHAEQNGEISLTNNSDFYSLTNHNVMAHGIQGTAFETDPALAPQTPTVVNFEGVSKTARKLAIGDRLVWIGKSSHLLGGIMQGSIQFIIKS